MATLFKANVKPQAGSIAWLNQCIERSKDGVFSEVTTLTPGLAGELLRRNPDNRIPSQTKIVQYATDMKTGSWDLNGEAIIISVDGLLNDGQTRAYAVIEANVSVPMNFTFGVSRNSRLTVDQGGARTAGNYLSMQGMPYGNHCAAVARMLLAYESKGGEGFGDPKYITNAEIGRRARADDAIIESVRFVERNHKKCTRYISLSPLAFCHYVFSGIDQADADEYIDQVAAGENITRKDPAYAVRERLLSESKDTRVAKIEIVMRGWNAFRQGRKLTLVKVLNSFPALV